MHSYHNILIRGVNRLGDTLFMMPSIKALKLKYPEARLSVLTKPLPADLYQHNPYIDEVIIFDYQKNHQGLPGRLKLIKTLRAANFDIAVLMHNNFESALMAFLSGIPERIGYQKELRAPLLTKSLPFPKDPTPRIDHFLAITKLIGCEAKINKPDLYLSKTEKEWGSVHLKDLPRPIVGIIPGAHEKTRIWDGGRFAFVADSIISSANASVLILGGPGDSRLSSMIKSKMKNIPFDMTGEFNLREFIAILSLCDLVISNDTGPMHIASLLDTNVITFFGAGDPIETSPMGANTHVIHRDLPCSPCLKSECSEGNYNCLKLITAEEVLELSLQILKNKNLLRHNVESINHD
jgi:heptosyltransferase II